MGDLEIMKQDMSAMHQMLEEYREEVQLLREELAAAQADQGATARLRDEVESLRMQLRTVKDEMSFFVKRHELPDGSYYVGGFERGRANGQGRRTWANGDVYEGNFIDDVMQGHGVLTWHDGSHYDGEWVNGKRHGQVPH